MYEDEIPVGRATDLTNKRFYNMIVLYRVKSTTSNAKWKCKCDCGNIFYAYANHIKLNKVKCCPTCRNKAKEIDITNQRFGKLTAIRPIDKNKYGIIWECQCDCGNIIYKTVAKLRAGECHSCGWCTGVKLQDLVGKTFGKLTVTKLGPKNKWGKATWYCDCECGTKNFLVDNNNLKRGLVGSCGCGVLSIGELTIQQLLNKNNILYETQKTYENCRFPISNHKARFDFYIVDKNYLIEYDGKQHFTDLDSFYQDATLIQRDNYKNQWCKDNNIPLIRIPYTHLNNLCIEDLLLETTQFRVV